MQNLKLINPLTREDVFETWREIEENIEHWKPFWEAKGHKSWSEWRRATHAPLFAKELNWGLYEVLDPLLAISDWRGSMFHGWSKWFYNSFQEQPPKLKDLLAHPGVHNHWYIREIANNFKGGETILTAVRLPNKDICIAEGMHRACAITMMAHNKIPSSLKVKVMLTDWPEETPPRLGAGWKK